MELYLQTPYTFTELYIIKHRVKLFDKLIRRPCLLCTQKVHYCVNKSLPVDLVLSQLNPSCTLTYFFSSRSSLMSFIPIYDQIFPTGFPPNFMCILHVLSLLTLPLLSNNTKSKSLCYVIFTILLLFPHFIPNVLLSNHFLNASICILP